MDYRETRRASESKEYNERKLIASVIAQAFKDIGMGENNKVRSYAYKWVMGIQPFSDRDWNSFHNLCALLGVSASRARRNVPEIVDYYRDHRHGVTYHGGGAIRWSPTAEGNC